MIQILDNFWFPFVRNGDIIHVTICPMPRKKPASADAACPIIFLILDSAKNIFPKNPREEL